MSVVNKMLQDLETRNAEPDMPSADYLPPSKNKTKNWVSVVIIFVLALGTYLWLMAPQWAQENQHTTNIVEVKTNASQDNLQSKPLDEEKTLLENETSTEELAFTPRSPVKTNQLQKVAMANLIDDGMESAGSVLKTSHQTTEIDSIPVSLPAKVAAIVMAQNSAQAIPVHQQPQPTVMPEVVDDVKYNKTAKTESHFSISNSSEKNKLAGAKQSVISAISEGDNELAVRRLEELLSAQPSNIEARKKLAALLFAQKRNEQAEHVLLQGIENHPLRSDLRLMMARLYMQKKDDEAAIQILADVQPDTANKREFLAYRAALLQQNTRYEQAKDDYIHLLEADAWNAKWWLGLAITQDRLGQSSEALSAYQTAYSKEQLSPSVVKFVEQRMNQIEGAQ